VANGLIDGRIGFLYRNRTLFVGPELAHLIYSRAGTVVLSVLFGAGALFFLALFVPAIKEAWILDARHGRTMAKVIDSRITDPGPFEADTYDLRYEFQLQKHGQPYVQSELGPLARKEIWTSLPKAKWEDAVKSGRIEVVYNPDYPRLNVAAEDFSRMDLFAYVGLGLSGVFLGASIGVFPISRHLRRKQLRNKYESYRTAVITDKNEQRRAE
jgi:hypothetical protein